MIDIDKLRNNSFRVIGTEKYRDGGTISIIFRMDGDNFEICLDNKIDSKYNGCFWVGYPYKLTSYVLTDIDIISKIKKELVEYIEINNNLLQEVLSV